MRSTRRRPLSVLATARPLKVLMLPNKLSEELEVLLHVVSDHPLAFIGEEFEGVWELRYVEFHRGMVVEDPNIISSPNKEPVVLSKAQISDDTAVLDRPWLPVSEPNDLDLLVLGRLDGHEVATLAIVEVLEALDLIGTLLDLPVTEGGILD